MEIVIRQETDADFDAVYRLVETAFACAEHADGTEQDLVVRLRRSASFIPRLSLVAQENKEIVGYALFTRVRVGESEALALAPLAVLPAHRRKGVGKALVGAGHALARALGYDYSIVLGDPAYYGRFGYVRASDCGIRPPFDVPSEYFMCCALRTDAAPIHGAVVYDDAFFG